MGTNSIWMQLPLITAVLPEAWSLPSDLYGYPGGVGMGHSSLSLIQGNKEALIRNKRRRQGLYLERRHPVEGKSLVHKEVKEGSIVGFSYCFDALVSAQMNGIIPSYAALPYSQLVYGLGITLSNIVSPFTSFLPFFVQIRSIPCLT
ncbi:unnamed protein product, partial [Mesorhabditis belari]|uniref:Riboflavin transporter n=1 Tax=Mesorhabditis belari TaxID=2138241 RepID=A0AAF3F248_9BILA